MKIIRKKMLFVILLVWFILLLMTIKANAVSLSVSTSKSTVAPGETFTVTVSLNGGAGKISSGGKTQFLDNSSFSYSMTAGNSGTITITASGVAAGYDTERDESVSASKTVTIKTPTAKPKPKPRPQPKKSSDSTLSKLTVEGLTISPEFKSDIKEYNLTIPYEVAEINVTAMPNSSKASVSIEGNKDLKEGQNTVKVNVIAEDGSTSVYTITVTRKRVPLALQSLIVKYRNENDEMVVLILNPEFAFDTLEYTTEDIEYYVDKLEIEAISNIEGAVVNIEGFENLQVGENTITITLKIAAEEQPEGVEEPKEEIITYTIKVNKKEEPTFAAKLSKWFKDFGMKVSGWFKQNEEKFVLSSLGVCIVSLSVLSVYIVIDYNKYKDIIAEAKKLQKLNNKKVKPKHSSDD